MKPATLNLTIVQGATFGPVVITCKDRAGNPVDLTEYNVWADCRKDLASAVAFSLSPVITSDVNGEITITKTDEQTRALPAGLFYWDLLLENPSGERLEPLVAGSITVAMINTRPA